MAKQTPSKTDKLATKQPQSSALAVPSYLQTYKGNVLGLEGTDASDFIMPRIALCQDLTPQRKKSDPLYIPGLEVGEFFNTATGENYGTSIDVVPLFFHRDQIKFRGKIGEGIECRAALVQIGNDRILAGPLHPADQGGCATCPHAQFGEDNEAPACMKIKAFISLPKGGSEPAAVSMKSTSLTVMRQWTSGIRSKRVPAFAQIWRLSSAEETKNKNTYQQFKVEFVGFVDEKFVQVAEGFFRSLREKKITIDMNDPDEQGDTGFDTATF